MLQNPIIQTLLLFLGCYFAMAFAQKLGGGSGQYVVCAISAISGSCALVIWMLRYERAKLNQLYAYPVLNSFIDLVAKMVKEQPPLGGAELSSDGAREDEDASAADDSKDKEEESEASETAREKRVIPKFLLLSDADFESARNKVRSLVKGQDSNILTIFEVLRENFTLRKSSASEADAPPLAKFLLLGATGLGKEHLATRVAELLFEKGAHTKIDIGISSPEAGRMAPASGVCPVLKKLLDAVRSNPCQTVILRDLDRASPSFKEALKLIFKQGWLENDSPPKRVNFKNCVFFTTVNKAVEDSPMGSMTSEVQNVSQLTGLDSVLLYSFDGGALSFKLPEDLEVVAEIVVGLMQAECRKYQKTLDHVSNDAVLREVRAVSRAGGFEVIPARIAKVLKDPINHAIKENKTAVTV